MSVAAASGTAAAAAAAMMVGPVMKKEYGAYGTVTLERSKLDLSKKTTKSSPEVSGPNQASSFCFGNLID